MGIKSTDLLPKINAEGVGTTPKSNLQIDADMFGAKQGKDLSNAGKNMMDMSAAVEAYGKKLGEDNDLKNKLEIENELARFDSEVFDGDGGIYSQELGDAEDSDKYLEQKMKKLSSLQKNRKYFSEDSQVRTDALIESTKTAMRGKVTKHKREQRKTHIDNMLTQRLKGLVAQGSEDWTYSEEMKIKEGRIADTLKKQLENQGYSTEKGVDGEDSMFDTMLKEQISAYYSNAITAALAADDADGLEIAIEVYDEAMLKRKLTGKPIGALAEAISVGGVKIVAQEISDEILAEFTSVDGQIDLQGGLDKIRNEYVGDQRVLALQYYRNQVKDASANRERQIEQKGLGIKEKQQDVAEKALSSAETYQKDLGGYTSVYGAEDGSGLSAGFRKIETDPRNKNDKSKIAELKKGLEEFVKTGRLSDDYKKKDADDKESARKREVAQKHDSNKKVANDTAINYGKKYEKDPSKGFKEIVEDYKKDPDEDLYEQTVEKYIKELKQRGASEDRIEKLRKEAEANKTAADKDRVREAKEKAPEEADIAMEGAKDEAEAYDNIDEDLSAEMIAEVTRIIKDKYATGVRVKSAADREMLDNAWENIIKGGSINDLSPEAMAALPSKSLTSMRAFEKSRGEREQGFSQYTNVQTYNKLHNMDMDDREAFAKYDINQDINELTESDYKYWRKEQRSIDKAGEREAKKAKSYTLANDLAKQSLRAAGIGYGAGATKRDNERANKVFQLVRDFVDQGYDSPDGKAPDQKALGAKLAELFLTGEMDGGSWFSNDTGAKYDMHGRSGTWMITNVKEQAPQISKATGIPAEAVEGLAKILNDHGMDINLDNFDKLWKTRKEGGYSKPSPQGKARVRRTPPEDSKYRAKTSKIMSGKKIHPSYGEFRDWAVESAGDVKDFVADVPGNVRKGVSKAKEATGKKSLGANKSKYDKDK